VDGNVNCSGEFQIDGTAFLGNVNNVASYSTQQTDTLLTAKADQSSTYTKTEADSLNSTQDIEIALNTLKTGITSGQATEITANTIKRTYPQTEEDKVTVNVTKRSYPQSEEDKVTVNVAKRTYPQAEEDKVTVNVAKRTYPQSEEDKVTVNVAKRTYPQSEEDKVTLNVAKRTYPQAEEDKVTANSASIETNSNNIVLKANLTTGNTFTGATVLQPSAITMIPLRINNYAANQYACDIYTHNHGARVMSKTTNSNTSIFEVRTNNYNTVNLKVKGNGTTEISTLKTTGNVGFFNKVPQPQPNTTGTGSTGATQNSGGAVNVNTSFTGGYGSTAYQISDIVLALKNLGLLAL
jgi:hypothetical protein